MRERPDFLSGSTPTEVSDRWNTIRRGQMQRQMIFLRQKCCFVTTTTMRRRVDPSPTGGDGDSVAFESVG